MRQTNLIDDLGWLLDEAWKPERVSYHTNKEVGMTHNEYDQWWLSTMGYGKNATPKYSVKKGKNTLGGNP